MNHFNSAKNKPEAQSQNLYYVIFLLLFSLPVFAAENSVEEVEIDTGIHGGRLLEEGNFSVELSIFEQGVPPEYRAWAMLDDNILDPAQWQLTVELSRLGGQRDLFRFSPSGDYLEGDGIVGEPHSFDVEVTAVHQGRNYHWQFESHEGRIFLQDRMAAIMEVGVHTAGPGEIHETRILYGKITPDPRQVSHITARYPGLIKEVTPALGDTITQGELVVTVEANDSLQTYEIRAPITGTVVDIHANPGEFAGQQTLMTIANYSNVFADLNVFPSDAQAVRQGQQLVLRVGDLVAQSSIRYMNPGEGLTPNVIARVPLGNPDQLWTPGLLVEAEVTVNRFDVPLRIDNRALQDFRDWRVVFIKIGQEYEIRPLTLGRSDGTYTEVLDGLNVGDQYVVENSYLLKADLEKSGASHDH